MLNQTALDERINKCKTILDDNPKSQIFAALSDAYRKNGELDKAFRLCRQGLRVHPDYGAGHLVMARISFDRKMYDWAENELLQAVGLDGRTRATDLLQAEINIKQEKYDSAKVFVDELIATDPENEYLTDLLLQIEKGKIEQKRKQFELERLYKTQSDEAMQASETGFGIEQKRKLSPTEALRVLSSFPGMVACFFADEKGLMIEADLPEYFDHDSYAALSAEIYRFSSDNVGRIKFGRVKQVLIEMDGEKVWMIDRGNHIMVLVLAENVNLGSLKLKILNVLSQMAEM
jgi:predicted regulator of Ras-like GTPase activity (Roadblock/LC7/MglB family)